MIHACVRDIIYSKDSALPLFLLKWQDDYGIAWLELLVMAYFWPSWTNL